MNADSIFITVSAGWIICQILFYLLLFFRGQKVKLKQGNTSIEADLKPGTYRVTNTGYVVPIVYGLTQIIIVGALIFLSPFLSEFVCNQFNSITTVDLDIQLVSTERKSLDNLLIEVNGDANQRLTDEAGNTTISLDVSCSKFPGCDCDLNQDLSFVIFSGDTILTKHKDIISTDWLKESKTTKYEIRLD